MLKKKLIGLAILASLGSAGAFAASAPAAASGTEAAYSGPVPAVLQQAMIKGGLDLYKKFQAAGSLNGWVVKDRNSGKYVIVYTTTDDSVLLAGMALDTSGANLTNNYAQEYIPATDYSPAYKSFTTEATSVFWGSASAKAEVTVVMDPNCPFCQRFERMLKPAVDEGALRVRLVPVAFEAPDSGVKAAGLLATKNIKAYMDSDVVRGQVEQSSDAGLKAKVDANWSLMRKFGLNGTPAVFYMSGKGNSQTLNVSPGLPDMTEFFKKLGLDGYIAKAKALDPQFAQYFH
ncbi:thiol:disulfide interchange protein DsbG [Paraburkholderia aspalathi]|nr:thiol:disulfide interchange protein DsbG [Paraburkholderia aspalathi]MBK3780041.1 thiol:disulfide interchange protein DsbG [Paraburkholderia aspalathi]